MKNKTIYFLSTFFPLISIIFTFNSNFSIESKYGRGIQILGYDSSDPIIDSTYKYNEHILDINLSTINSILFKLHHSSLSSSLALALMKSALFLWKNGVYS